MWQVIVKQLWSVPLKKYTTLFSGRGSMKRFFFYYGLACQLWIMRSSRTSSVRWHSLTQSSRPFMGFRISSAGTAVARVTQVVLIPHWCSARSTYGLFWKCQLAAVTFCGGVSWSNPQLIYMQVDTLYTEYGFGVWSCPLAGLKAGALDIGIGMHSWR